MSIRSSRPSPELGTSDGGSDSYIQTVGGFASRRIVGDEEPPIDMLRHFGRDAVALVAHDDDATRRERLLVEVPAVEEGALDRCFLR